MSLTTATDWHSGATPIRFVGKTDEWASALLVLSNISTRPISFELKSNHSTVFRALPGAQGLLAPRSSERRLLMWRDARADSHAKLLLLTRFADVDDDAPDTHTRLVAQMHTAGDSNADPPIVQLLLDDPTDTVSNRTDSCSSLSSRSPAVVERSSETLPAVYASRTGVGRTTVLAVLLLMAFFFYLSMRVCLRLSLIVR
jgi:hypothetical protein